MIHLVTGSLGSGKSFYAVRKAAEALNEGKCVATNIALRDDFDTYIAKSYWSNRITGRTKKKAARIRDSFFHSDDLHELFAVRLAGAGEGRGVMILDEAHGWMNSRTWSAEDRGKIVAFFSQARKLGWHVYLITQDEKNIDRQVRSMFEYHVRLRNIKRFRVAGIPITWFNLFVAIWSWNNSEKTVIKRECYGLNFAKNLYDTFETHHGLDDVADAGLVLPRTAGRTPEADAAPDATALDPALRDLPDATLAVLTAPGRSPGIVAEQAPDATDGAAQSAGSGEAAEVRGAGASDARSAPGLVTPGLVPKMDPAPPVR